MLRTLCVATSVASVCASACQAALATGDISIIGFRSDSDDAIAFVTWVPLLPGTSLYFTDSGFHGNGTFGATENVMSWTAPVGGVAAGTVVVINAPATAVADLGTASGSFGGLATGGDQVFVGDATFPLNVTITEQPTYSGKLIFGLDFYGSAGWDTDTTGATNSALPPSLNVTGGNISLTHVDNAQYKADLRTFSDLAAAKSSVLNLANWSVSDDGDTFGALSSTDFVVPEPGILGSLALAGILATRRRRY